MNFRMKKTRISAILVIALMFASLLAVAVPSAKAFVVNTTGQPGVVQQAQTNYPVSFGYPDLGPLPAGVTPQYTEEQTAYISVSPTPIGLNQQVLINVWTTPGMNHPWYGAGYTVDIIKPDGTTQTLGPVNSYMGDDTFWWLYNVDQLGTWQFKFKTTGTYLPAKNYTDSPTGQSTFAVPGNIQPLGASVLFTPSTSSWF